MIEEIITLTKESEYKSGEIAVEKRKGDLLLYDVSLRLCSHRASVLMHSNNFLIFTARKRSCGKIMFSQEYVSHSVHGGRGGLPYHNAKGQADPFPSIGRTLSPLRQADLPPPPRSTGGRYASYWNAYL